MEDPRDHRSYAHLFFQSRCLPFSAATTAVPEPSRDEDKQVEIFWDMENNVSFRAEESQKVKVLSANVIGCPVPTGWDYVGFVLEVCARLAFEGGGWRSDGRGSIWGPIRVIECQRQEQGGLHRCWWRGRSASFPVSIGGLLGRFDQSSVLSRILPAEHPTHLVGVKSSQVADKQTFAWLVELSHGLMKNYCLKKGRRPVSASSNYASHR